MKFSRMAAVIAVGLLSAACTRVGPGEVGVLYHTMGGDKGVDIAPVGVGYHYTGPGTGIAVFPTFTQNVNWTEKNNEQFSFSDMNGLNATADVGISYHVDADKAPMLYQKYRQGIDEITDLYVHNMVRDALIDHASHMQIEEIYGAKRQDLILAVQADVQKQVAQLGLEIEHVYWIGNLGLPDSIRAAINSKNAAVQQAQQRENEVATATAQAQIEVAKATGEGNAKKIAADAESYANKTIALSITPELLELNKIKKWDGTNSAVVTGGSGAGVLVNMGSSLK